MIAWAGHPDSWDIYGKLLSSDDSGLTSSSQAIANDVFNEFSPALAAGADGKVLAVYRHFIAQAPYGSFRIAARLVDPSGFALGTAGAGGESTGGAGSIATGGASGIGGSGDNTGGAAAGAMATGGSTNAGAAGGHAETGEGGETDTGGSTQDVAGTSGAGAAGVHGGHESGGSGCAVSPRRAPARAALPIAFMLMAFAGWRRSRRVARTNQRRGRA